MKEKRGLKNPWARVEGVFLVHLHNSLNGLVLNCCTGSCWFTRAYCIEEMDNNSYHRSTLSLSYFLVRDGHSREWRRRPMHENSFEGDEKLGDD